MSQICLFRQGITCIFVSCRFFQYHYYQYQMHVGLKFMKSRNFESAKNCLILILRTDIIPGPGLFDEVELNLS